MPLGLTALSLGHIISEELQLALARQRQKGGRIGEVLVELGFADQAQITAALASQWGHPVLSLKNRHLEVPHHIPRKLMEIHSMLPIHFVARTNKLVIGFAEFVEHRILSTIEAMLDCTVVPCFITRDEFANHYQALRAEPGDEEVVFERPSTIPEIAAVTRSYALQINANLANFGVCGDYVWGRLQNAQNTIDLLSRI